jgi:TM2 domain-containing membrane protein YozV
MKLKLLPVMLLWIAPLYAGDTLSDAAGKSVDLQIKSGSNVSAPADRDTAAPPVQLKRYNPGIAAGLSLLVPGSGQAYTKHYVKAGCFLAVEAIMGVTAYQMTLNADYQRKLLDQADADQSDYASRAAFFSDSLGRMRQRGLPGAADSQWAQALSDSSVVNDSLSVLAGYNRDKHAFDHKLARQRIYNAFCWMAGCHLYNILDAVQGAGVFNDAGPRDPKLAGWLSAVPLLGLGQFYNGSARKAGMIMMVEGGLGYVTWSYWQLMLECERKISWADTVSIDQDKRVSLLNDWNYRRRFAFRSRNTYLWYLIMFYFYGIFDAVVDANLHDAPDKMRLSPDLAFGNSGVELSVRLNF